MCISFKFVAANLKKKECENKFLKLIFFCLIKKINYIVIRKIDIDISYFILLIIFNNKKSYIFPNFFRIILKRDRKINCLENNWSISLLK